VSEVRSVRIGKRIEIEFDGEADLERAHEIADKLLANPVIEDFHLRVEATEHDASAPEAVDGAATVDADEQPAEDAPTASADEGAGEEADEPEEAGQPGPEVAAQAEESEPATTATAAESGEGGN
jgi:hypothetical protein